MAINAMVVPIALIAIKGLLTEVKRKGVKEEE
jgi:hypothetical protein